MTGNNHFCGSETEKSSFFRVPRALIKDAQFRGLSTDAKLLYGLMLDRMGLSQRSGWIDADRRVFIYFTLDEIQSTLYCGHDKAVKLLAELDTGKGFGLIERIKQGQGRPTKIYVKRFTTREKPPQPAAPQDTPRLPIFRSQDFGKSDANYIKSIQTDPSYLDPSIHLSAPANGQGLMDRNDCREEIKESIEYPSLCQQYNREDVDEVVELIADILCSSRPTVRIGGEEIPTTQAQERFQLLNYDHLQYVFDCLRKNTTEIRNIRAYLLTALYNAPATINSYYKAAVQHDFGP